MVAQGYSSACALIRSTAKLPVSEATFSAVWLSAAPFSAANWGGHQRPRLSQRGA
jgi:hypothetical protein